MLPAGAGTASSAGLALPGSRARADSTVSTTASGRATAGEGLSKDPIGVGEHGGHPWVLVARGNLEGSASSCARQPLAQSKATGASFFQFVVVCMGRLMDTNANTP